MEQQVLYSIHNMPQAVRLYSIANILLVSEERWRGMNIAKAEAAISNDYSKYPYKMYVNLTIPFSYN